MLRLFFAPHDGQAAIGTCVVSADDEIQQRVVAVESTITRFADPPAMLSQGLVQTQSLQDGQNGGVPRIEIALKAASELDAETVVTNRVEVPKCIQPEFSLTAAPPCSLP